MILGSKKAALALLLGDAAAFFASLWITLLVRYGEAPSRAVIADHAEPFALLFAAWLIVFYLSGLYSKRILLFKSRLPDALMKTQAFNIALAAVFFFLVPAFGIAPKTVLIIYLVVSLALIFLWRLVIHPKITMRGARVSAALIASGAEADEIEREVNGNARYGIRFAYVRKPADLTDPARFARELSEAGVSLLVVDTDQVKSVDILPMLYRLVRAERRYQIAEFENVYEEVFDRIPLSRLEYEWFLRNVSPANTAVYAAVKRLIDIAGGVLMGAVTVIAIPFVWMALQIESPGALFIRQDRLGERGASVRAYKFRSMRFSDGGMWPGEGANTVTRVGGFLRRTSLDEFPQFVNVISGELSLIGPRNDLQALGKRLAEAIPYYDARYLVKPGITGWAQINQQYEPGAISPSSVEETKMRLAYDFYYLKNRSLGLDLVIALKTLKRMFFRVSSW
jgi:lipopolysaccharide/colanic/teichoic acid biosynthesis glycosyltransferase